MTALRSLALTAWRALVDAGFRLLYNRMAWAYDVVSHVASLGRWRSWQRAIWPRLPAQGKVLEVAAGPGHLLLDLGRAGFQVLGLDLSPTMLRLSRHRLLKAGLACSLVRGRAAALPIAAATVDVVVATFPTAFVYDRQWVGEATRVLKPGGRLLIVTMATFCRDAPAARLLEWLYRITGQRGPEADLAILLEEAGLAAWRETAEVDRTTVSLVLAEKRIG